MVGAKEISIHALREEGDRLRKIPGDADADFYPRPPRGGRHIGVRVGQQVDVISIHALREEGDVRFARWEP